MPQVSLSSIVALSDTVDMPIFIVEVEPDDTLRYHKINRFYEQAMGLSSADLAGKTPHEVMPPRLAADTLSKYMTCVQSGEPFTYEEGLDLAKGEAWWQTTLSPLVDVAGRVFAIVGVTIDITAHKDQELQDAKVISELKMLNEEINTYTSLAAHDVRGPLRKIKVISELVFADVEIMSEQKGDGDETFLLAREQVDLITSIGALAAKTLEHVDSILSYARALALEEQAVMEEIDLKLLLNDLIGLVDGDEKFVFELPTLHLSAERIILQIVLRNLLENAVKFGESTCQIHVGPCESRPDHIRFVVSDDGAGFEDGAVLSEQSLKSRLKSPTSGFGLASAQRMIEQRGGEMWLAPPNYGTGANVAFTVRGKVLS